MGRVHWGDLDPARQRAHTGERQNPAARLRAAVGKGSSRAGEEQEDHKEKPQGEPEHWVCY